VNHSTKLGTAALAGAAALALVLSGCSNTPTTSGDDQVLTVLGVSETRDALEAAIAAFKEENEGVDFSVQYTEEASINSVLPTQLSAGNAPDIFAIWPGTYSASSAVGLGQRGFLADLSSEPWVGDVPASFDPYIGAEGKVYYPPIVALSVITMYNQTTLDELGLEIPQTWDDVLGLCDAAKAAGVTAYAYGAQTDWQNQMLVFLLNATLVDRTTPDFLTERAAGDATFADSPWVDVFAQEKEMNDRGCFSSPLGTSFEIATSQVGSGQALGMFSVSSTFASVQEAAGDDTIVAAALPATNNADDTWLPVAPGGSYGVNAKSDEAKQALAKKFIDFLMEPANAAAYANASGQAPGITNADFEPTDASSLQVQFSADGRTAPVADQLFPTPKVRDAWITNNQALLAGDATPEQVAAAMDAAWDQG
jgi:raffinose/stachyose/melibiose transport system substrate-binding protein